MIGLFDSGSGGLSVLKALRQELPQADIRYFGDIRNAPYGEKTHAELTKLTYSAIQLLQERGVKNIVSACNSVSASLAISLFDTLAPDQTIIEMVGPAVAALREDERRIAVCATEATIRSQMYENGLRMIGKKEVVIIAIPDLAGQIEFGASPEEMEKVIRAAFAPHIGAFDVCVLACTHYPLVRELFEKVLGNQVELFDPAVAVATRAKKLFEDEQEGSGQVTFLLSQDSKQFRNYVATHFNDQNPTIEIV